jgi:O-antigen ligase
VMSKSDMSKICIRGLDISLLLLFIFPILPLRISGFSIIPLAVFAILNLAITGFDKKKDESWLIFLAFLILPIMYLSELIYTENSAYVWREVQRKMGLIIIPFLFIMIHHSRFKMNVNRYLNAFVIAVLSLVLFTLTMLIVYGVNQDYLVSGGLPFALRTTVEELVGLHPTYLGIVVAFSAIVLVERLSGRVKENCFGFIQAMQVLAIMLMSGFLFLIAARIVILAYILVLMVLAIKGTKSLKWRFGIVSIVGISSLVALFTVPIISDRMMEFFDSSPNSTNVRTMIYGCSWGVISEHWFFGVGVERLQPLLDTCYRQFQGVTSKSYFQYNTHNEFLNILCAKGISGLMVFAGLLTLLFRQAKGNGLAIAFLLLFGVTCITENLLERQIGVFFFSVFGSLFGIVQIDRKK